MWQSRFGNAHLSAPFTVYPYHDDRAGFIGQWMGLWKVPLKCSVGSWAISNHCVQPNAWLWEPWGGYSILTRLLTMSLAGSTVPSSTSFAFLSVSSGFLQMFVPNTLLSNLLLPSGISFLHCIIYCFSACLLSIRYASNRQGFLSPSSTARAKVRVIASDPESRQHLCLHHGMLGTLL